MQKASQTPRQKASLEGKKRQSSYRSYSRMYQGQSSISEEAQPRIRVPYKREHKFKYLIYSALLFLNFCSSCCKALKEHLLLLVRSRP